MSLTWNKNLRNRIIVTLIGAPALLFMANSGSYLFLALILLITSAGIVEMNIMGRELKYSSNYIPELVFSIAVLLDTYFFNSIYSYGILSLYLFLTLALAVFIESDNRLNEISFKILSFFYLSIFLNSTLMIREYDFSSGYEIGGKFMVMLFLCIWLLDTIAYAAGRAFGKKKLFPRISPKKTVAGGVGGFISCVAVAVISAFTYFDELSIIHAVIIGAIIGITGQVGDLVESFFKRQTGIKDSSSILPGHGGILDRFDSLIFVSPIVFIYLKYIIIDI